ncbi:MAG: Sua5/YciO/YrdC/YwlC family protein, partial [Bacilli bacterium]|nr:Sua5/YciO/YrdC/YwlC family protein [Bacilli bacterium]
MKLIDKNKIIKKINMNMIAVLPTDTVYGIMAKFNRKNEIKINKFKKSDINKKISVIFYNKKELFNYIEKLSFFRKLIIKILLPGKYTIIVD